MFHGSRNTALDLGVLFSSPLTALIEAQSLASHATLAYLRAVGLDGDRLRTTHFKLGPDPSGSGAPVDGPGTELTVPTLSLLTIPNLRIAEASIEFQAKIVGLCQSAPGTSAAADAALPRLQAALTHRRRSHRGEEETGQYTMQVKLRVVQDELAPGVEQLLHKAFAAQPAPQSPDFRRETCIRP